MNRLKRLLENKILSIVLTLAFATFNLTFGIIKSYVFGISIAIYYFLFCAIKIALFVVSKKSEPDSPKLVGISAGLFVLNIALIAPIALMVMWKRTFNLGIIPAITVATYTVYKITSAILGYKKVCKAEDEVERVSKSATLIDTVVSVLLLQNTLLVAQNSELNHNMYVLTICTSAIAYAVTIIISIVALRRTLVVNKMHNR